ncbi:hypothetical protein EPN29_04400 [bacterium]|nr:MAG: hypothetical protein EPN29_04400 [bacterium]
MSNGFTDTDFSPRLSEQSTTGRSHLVLDQDRDQVARPLERQAGALAGICEDCNQEIGAERHAALPGATRCVRCQVAWEQFAR